MTTTTPPAALMPVEPVFTNTERLSLAGFLAGYSGLTRDAYALDLRQYTSSITCDCSRPAGRTSNASPATWNPGGRAPPP
jgi:hypothetical protein